MYKDLELKIHCENTRNLCKSFGKFLNLDKRNLFNLICASYLHDIGKINIPNEILYKNGKLNEEEIKIIRQHVKNSYFNIINLGFSNEIGFISLFHHERYDGLGYPFNLKGENIPFLSRILSICDSFDAMTTPRCYKQVLTSEYALKEILANSGTQFDPELAKKFNLFYYNSDCFHQLIKSVNRI